MLDIARSSAIAERRRERAMFRCLLCNFYEVWEFVRFRTAKLQKWPSRIVSRQWCHL